MISRANIQLGRRAMLLLVTLVTALAIASGAALAATITCQVNVDCLGTRNADTLRGLQGADDNNHIYGRGGADTLKGYGGGDLLYGQGDPDELLGGAEQDTLIGGSGNDILNGGEGLDYYHFGTGWGKDSVTEGTTSPNVALFTSSPETEEPVAEDLTINLISGKGPEAKTEDATSTINWESNAIEHVISGTGDDRITGNSAKNHIYGVSGADIIYAGGGDDEVRVRDGSGDDVVDCGENFIGSDDDAVYFDDGDEINANCEAQYPG